LVHSQSAFDRVVDFHDCADDPLDTAQYLDGVHPATVLHYELAGTWDISVRLGLKPGTRRHYIRTTSNTDVGLKIAGKAGGQTAHLQDWEIGIGPASYVDGLGNICARSLSVIRPDSGVTWANGGIVGPLAAMPFTGTGLFFDNVSAKMVFKTSASEQWCILNTGNLVPLKPNDIGSNISPVRNLHVDTLNVCNSEAVPANLVPDGFMKVVHCGEVKYLPLFRPA
jgi:hypothetical protein